MREINNPILDTLYDIIQNKMNVLIPGSFTRRIPEFGRRYKIWTGTADLQSSVIRSVKITYLNAKTLLISQFSFR